MLGNPSDLTPSPKPLPLFWVAMPTLPEGHQCTCKPLPMAGYFWDDMAPSTISLHMPPSTQACSETHPTSHQALNPSPFFWWPCQHCQRVTNAHASLYPWLGIFGMTWRPPQSACTCPHQHKHARKPIRPHTKP